MAFIINDSYIHTQVFGTLIRLFMDAIDDSILMVSINGVH
jgi:hypothetical protein